MAKAGRKGVKVINTNQKQGCRTKQVLEIQGLV